MAFWSNFNNLIEIDNNLFSNPEARINLIAPSKILGIVNQAESYNKSSSLSKIG